MFLDSAREKIKIVTERRDQAKYERQARVTAEMLAEALMDGQVKLGDAVGVGSPRIRTPEEFSSRVGRLTVGMLALHDCYDVAYDHLASLEATVRRAAAVRAGILPGPADLVMVVLSESHLVVPN